MDLDRSMVSVTVASSYLPEITTAIRSLVQYPYGCIEQTIGSTLPNALVLHLDTFGSIGIDQDQARENVKHGLAKILRMQHYSGGWEYWEGDGDANIHITPYVLRSLIALRNLGETIPDTVIEKGAQYILTNLSTYQADPDNLAEALWTLALIGKKTEALSALKDIDTSKLSRHGYLAYAYTAHLLDIYPQTLTFTLDTVLFGSGTTNSETYWYWDTLADMGIYAQLLLDRGEEEKAFALIDRLVRGTDLSSSTLSTQAKIQIFRALLKQLQKTDTPLKNTFPIALRGDALIADASLGPKKQFIQIDASRQKF